jgi:hypothetical protein
MQLQCSSVSGAVLQYSLQYLLSAGAGQLQLGCAHFRGSGEPDLVSGMVNLAFSFHYALPAASCEATWGCPPQGTTIVCAAVAALVPHAFTADTLTV